jgi:hypothetical protein
MGTEEKTAGAAAAGKKSGEAGKKSGEAGEKSGEEAAGARDGAGLAMTDLRKTRSTSVVRAMVTVVSMVTATGMGTSASGASSTAAIGG